MILATEQHFQLPKIQGVVGEERRYILLEDYCVEWTERGKRYRRTVFANVELCSLRPDKPGCTTDLASVPPAAGIVGHTSGGPSDGGAIPHDDDYLKLGRKDGPGKFGPGEFQVWIPHNSLNPLLGEWVDCDEKYTRARSDWRYFKNCMLGGMPMLKAFREYLALRVGAISPKNRLIWYFS